MNTFNEEFSTLTSLEIAAVYGGVDWGQVLDSANSGAQAGAAIGGGVGLAVGGGAGAGVGGAAGGLGGFIVGGAASLINQSNPPDWWSKTPLNL